MKDRAAATFVSTPMRRALALLVLLPSIACAGSNRGEPTPAELAEVCARVRCRPPTALKIPIDETHVYKVEFPASPWVAGPGLISLLPGETITITGTVDGDQLVDLVVVDTTPEPTPNTIVLEFAEPVLGRTIMTIANHFDAVLVYELGMFVPGKDGLYPTTAIPVQPGLRSVELWPYPIVQLALAGFRFERAP